MLNVAVCGELPEALPAPLEMVIDGTVKTGADLGQVREWCYAHSRDLLERGVHIPAALHHRLSVDRGRDPWDFVPPPIASDEADGYAFDRAMAMKDDFRAEMKALRSTYVDEAMPPRALFEIAFAEPRWV